MQKTVKTTIMHKRLLDIIKYATGGHRADFAVKMNWSPQYLNRMLTGDGGIGIKPVIAILEAFPEISARWFILGEGVMITSGYDELKCKLKKLLDIEIYMPVMSTEELRLLNSGNYDFNEETINKWKELITTQATCKIQTAK